MYIKLGFVFTPWKFCDFTQPLFLFKLLLYYSFHNRIYNLHKIKPNSTTLSFCDSLPLPLPAQNMIFFIIYIVNKILANHIQRPFKALFSAYTNPSQQHRTKTHCELRSEHFQWLNCSTEHSSKETLKESMRECEPMWPKRTRPQDRGCSTIPQLLKGAGRVQGQHETSRSLYPLHSAGSE